MSTPPITERRRNPTNDHAIMLDIVKQTRDDVHDLKQKLTEHIQMEEDMTATLIKNLSVQSFPDGNPDLHRMYHEAVIKREEEKALFWKKMLFELVKWGLLGFLGWMVVEAWIAFLRGPKP